MLNKTESILKVFLIFILIILISTSVRAANEIKTVKFGDVNEDGKIEVFYSDPDGSAGWASIDGFDHISTIITTYLFRSYE